MAVVLKAKEATIKFSSTDLTIDTTGAIDSDFTGSADNQVKNITVSTPEGGVEIISCLGESSNFQNAYLDEKAFGLATCTGTLILDGDETELFKMMGGTSGTTVTGGYTRYQFGSSTATKTRVKVGGALINLDNGSEEVSIVFDNAYVTKFGDIKPTGADGHWEVDFEMVCLPKDFYIEFKD